MSDAHDDPGTETKADGPVAPQDAADPTTSDPATSQGAATTDDDAQANAGASDTSDARPDGEGVDLKGIFRQLTAPMIESLDTRLREQVEAHVDELLATKVEAAIADRLATVDRAIADLSRSLDALAHRLTALESHGEDLSL